MGDIFWVSKISILGYLEFLIVFGGEQKMLARAYVWRKNYSNPPGIQTRIFDDEAIFFRKPMLVIISEG